MHDIRRGGISYDTGMKTFKMKDHGHHVAVFDIPLNIFNNGEFRLIASLRIPNPNDDQQTDAVGVAVDENACTFVIQDERNRNYALLSDRSLTMTQVDDSIINI